MAKKEFRAELAKNTSKEKGISIELGLELLLEGLALMRLHAEQKSGPGKDQDKVLISRTTLRVLKYFAAECMDRIKNHDAYEESVLAYLTSVYHQETLTPCLAEAKEALLSPLPPSYSPPENPTTA